MRITRAVLLLTLIVSLLISVEGTPAQPPAPIPAYAADSSVVSIVHELRQILTTVSLPLTKELSRNSFELRQQISILSDTLVHLAAELAGKTYGQLERQQQDFFVEADAAMTGWHVRSKLTVAEVNRVLVRTHDVIGTTPTGRRAPRVQALSPPFVWLGKTPAQPIVIKVSGAQLGTGTPSLLFGNSMCDLQSHRASEIVFSCAPRLLVSGASVATNRPRLTVYRQRTLFEAFFQYRPQPLLYTPVVIAAPLALGTYKVTAIGSMQRLEEAQRQSQEFQHANDSCEGPREVAWTVERTPGWTIDVNTLDVQVLARTGETRSPVILDRSGAGLRLGGTVKNAGTCATSSDGTKTEDVKGSLRVRVAYREYRTVAAETSTELQGGALRWGQDVSVPLPELWTRVAVEVNQFDGKRFVETTLPSAQPWFTVSFDPRRRHVVIHAKTLAAVLD